MYSTRMFTSIEQATNGKLSKPCNTLMDLFKTLRICKKERYAVPIIRRGVASKFLRIAPDAREANPMLPTHDAMPPNDLPCKSVSCVCGCYLLIRPLRFPIAPHISNF